MRARRNVTGPASRADTQADPPLRRHENPILDLHPADLDWTKHSGIPTHICSSPVTLAISPRTGCLKRSLAPHILFTFQGHTCSLCSRSEEHTSELKSLMRISYAVFCLKKKNNIKNTKIAYEL